MSKVVAVHISIHDVDGLLAQTIQTEVTKEQLDYMLAVMPLAYSLPLSKQLREGNRPEQLPCLK